MDDDFIFIMNLMVADTKKIRMMDGPSYGMDTCFRKCLYEM